MLSLSPEKLLFVLVVTLVVVGPEKLPRLARQLGRGWRQLRLLHQRIEAELRETVPDLPSTQEIVRIARSPLSMLTSLADLDEPLEADKGVGGAPAPERGEAWPADPEAPAAGDPDEDEGSAPAIGAGVRPIDPVAGTTVPRVPRVVLGDPSMN